MNEHFIHLQRREPGDDHTYGDLTFFEYKGLTIEDEPRDVKVPGETCIPAQTFEIVLRDEGGMTKKYRERFPDFHQGMLWLRPTNGDEEITNENGDVWTYCYIHCGVTDDHTDGCLIIGRNEIIYQGQPGVSHSSAEYEVLYKMIVGLLNAGDKVFITIRDYSG